MRQRISQLLKSANSLKSATGILVVTALLSNILGLVRNTVIAHNIPLGLQDNFWSAFLLPDLIFNVLIFGAISSAFIPLFKGLWVEKRKEEAWDLAGSFLGQLTVLIIILDVVMFVGMPWLISVVFPRLAAGDAHSVMVLARWLLLQTLLLCWSYLVGGILNARQRFFAYSLSPLVYNISIIVGAVLAPRFGHQGIMVMIWSVIVGAGLHFLVQLPSVIAVGMKLRYISLRHNQYAREALLLMIPRSLSLGILSINELFLAAIARALLTTGALSIYRLVEAFQTAPIAIFANAIAVALFPQLTGFATKQDWRSFGKAMEKAFRFILFTMIPSTIIFILLRAQIIRLYIGLGSDIGWADTIRAINLFGWFAMGMVPAGLVAVLARSFYAVKNTWLPLAAAAVSLLFGVSTAYALSATTKLDVSALGIASTGADLVQFILLYIAYLRFVKKPLDERPVLITGLKTIIASLAMAVSTWISLRAVDRIYALKSVEHFNTHRVIGLGVQTFVSLGIGLAVFLLIAYYLMPEEWLWLRNFRRRDAAKA